MVQNISRLLDGSIIIKKRLPESTIIPTIPGNASAEKDGLMSKTDKAKLDALPVFTFEKVGEA